ncbi:MAG: hypothetical protein JRN24_02805, partial [Nitrososphaerota archaeon]|nr:hypothetical protein [Nitrososphaerota archaeon]
MRRLFEGMSEEEAREFLLEAYENQGWTVKDLHSLEPRFEEGADLRLERDETVWLVQVKKRPVKDDLPQLAKLAQRNDAGARYYCFLEQPTESFRTGSKEYSERVQFLAPPDLHRLLLENESTGYLLRVFELHPLVQDMAKVLSTIWRCRRNRQGAVEARTSELHILWDMKDATLKMRSSLAILNLEWDDLMNRTSKDRGEYPELLDKA